MSQKRKQRYEHGYHAMKCTFEGIKSKYIAMAMIEGGLWSMKLGSAAARVRACMRPESDQFFKTSDLLYLMWHFERFDLFYYWCDCLQHERPKRLTPGSPRAVLIEQMRRLEEQYEELRLQVSALGADPLPIPKFLMRKEDIDG